MDVKCQQRSPQGWFGRRISTDSHLDGSFRVDGSVNETMLVPAAGSAFLCAYRWTEQDDWSSTEPYNLSAGLLLLQRYFVRWKLGFTGDGDGDRDGQGLLLCEFFKFFLILWRPYCM